MNKDNFIFGKHLDIILKEMCRRVGANFNDINFKEKYRQKYSWNEIEFESFIKWLENYFINNPECRQEMFRHEVEKEKLIKVAVTFAFIHGWSIKLSYES